MNEEQKKEICKAYFYGHPIVQIAEIEDVSDEEVVSAVNWGKQNGYMDELKERYEELNEKC